MQLFDNISRISQAQSVGGRDSDGDMVKKSLFLSLDKSFNGSARAARN